MSLGTEDSVGTKWPGADGSGELTASGEGKKYICREIRNVMPGAMGALEKMMAAQGLVTGAGWSAKASEEVTVQHTCPLWPSVSRSV